MTVRADQREVHEPSFGAWPKRSERLNVMTFDVASPAFTIGPKKVEAADFAFELAHLAKDILFLCLNELRATLLCAMQARQRRPLDRFLDVVQQVGRFFGGGRLLGQTYTLRRCDEPFTIVGKIVPDHPIGVASGRQALARIFLVE